MVDFVPSSQPSHSQQSSQPSPFLPSAAQPRAQLRLLLVDLNNFASFPTLAIGLLVAALRAKGHEVRLLSPLAHGVPAAFRERRESLRDHWARRLHLTDHPLGLWLRDAARRVRSTQRERPDPAVLTMVETALAEGCDAVLLSAYLQHHRIVADIAARAKARGIKVLLGGPMFSVADTAKAWAQIPGVDVVVGAEADLSVARIVRALVDGASLEGAAGIVGGPGGTLRPAAPLRSLGDVPMADFRDFPWDRYPVRIIPMMTGRGCQWDKCVFCSDVVSVSGRTFRTRSVDNVLAEMQEQARRHATTNFLFLDLKLNSHPDMLRGIAEGARCHVPGAEWVGTVHVDLRRDNGLSPQDLALAVAGGMRRVSFGLESGSQRLLDLMQKGSSVEANSAFIRHAHEAGLSLRCTMFKGFPGETAADMEATADFLERHMPYLDRVRFNDFTLNAGTRILRDLVAGGGAATGVVVGARNDQRATVPLRNPALAHPAYRRAKARALRAVYQINRRPLRLAARQFDGLM